MTTPHQQAHRQALLEIWTVPQDMDTTPTQARIRLDRALRSYHKAASRPRKGYCWAWVYSELSNSRSDALRTGLFPRHSLEDAFVALSCQRALERADLAVVLEGRGIADVRV
jgi:hypothetical protein